MLNKAVSNCASCCSECTLLSASHKKWITDVTVHIESRPNAHPPCVDVASIDIEMVLVGLAADKLDRAWRFPKRIAIFSTAAVDLQTLFLDVVDQGMGMLTVKLCKVEPRVADSAFEHAALCQGPVEVRVLFCDHPLIQLRNEGNHIANSQR